MNTSPATRLPRHRRLRRPGTVTLMASTVADAANQPGRVRRQRYVGDRDYPDDGARRRRTPCYRGVAALAALRALSARARRRRSSTAPRAGAAAAQPQPDGAGPGGPASTPASARRRGSRSRAPRFAAPACSSHESWQTAATHALTALTCVVAGDRLQRRALVAGGRQRPAVRVVAAREVQRAVALGERAQARAPGGVQSWNVTPPSIERQPTPAARPPSRPGIWPATSIVPLASRANAVSLPPAIVIGVVIVAPPSRAIASSSLPASVTRR